jgi:translation initiation factor 2B subunit (eIF-2B alpha/beta/delta family)
VMICCETCKFQEKVQLDSICSNELGNPVAVATVQVREAGQPVGTSRRCAGAHDLRRA